MAQGGRASELSSTTRMWEAAQVDGRPPAQTHSLGTSQERLRWCISLPVDWQRSSTPKFGELECDRRYRARMAVWRLALSRRGNAPCSSRQTSTVNTLTVQ